MQEPKRILFFDLESNGLLDTMDRIHCLVISDGSSTKRYTPVDILKGITELQEAINKGVSICGHNIINFDIPAIQILYPTFEIPRDKRHLVIDTLVLSRLCYSDIKERDSGLLRAGRLPGKLFGSHGLKAWGYRLGEYKGTYAEDTEDAWACFSEEMLDYCEQDVVVTKILYDKLMSRLPTESSVELEHKAQWLMQKMKVNGFPFDLEKAQTLEGILRKRAGELNKNLLNAVPYLPDKEFTPKVNNKARGYAKGCGFTKIEEFNPNSRQQIEWVIRKHYKYNPLDPDLYDDEQMLRLKIDETTFKFIKEDPKAPEKVQKLAVLLEESLTISKRLGQLADGQNAWLKCMEADGAIHGDINPNGAVTGRATHARPNIAQVPASGSPYGHECRELFKAPEGWLQCGVDASGLELRCLGHFMAPYDGGRYAETVVNGDIHTLNQEAAGLPTRDNAKTFIYGFLKLHY